MTQQRVSDVGAQQFLSKEAADEQCNEHNNRNDSATAQKKCFRS